MDYNHTLIIEQLEGLSGYTYKFNESHHTFYEFVNPFLKKCHCDIADTIIFPKERRRTYVFNQQASTRRTWFTHLLIWVHDDYASMITQNLSFEK